jgi:hypothetical protein
MEHWRKLTHLPTGRVDIVYLLEQVGVTEIHGPVGDQMYRDKRAAKRSHDRTSGVSISLGLTPSSDFHPRHSSLGDKQIKKSSGKTGVPMKSPVATCQARTGRCRFPVRFRSADIDGKHCLKGTPLIGGTAEHGFFDFVSVGGAADMIPSSMRRGSVSTTRDRAFQRIPDHFRSVITLQNRSHVFLAARSRVKPTQAPHANGIRIAAFRSRASPTRATRKRP